MAEKLSSSKDKELIETTPWSNPEDAEKVSSHRQGEVVSISESEFRGDPRRVIGHYSNPINGADFKSLFPPNTEQDGERSNAKSSDNPELITEIPPELGIYKKQ